MRIYTKSFLLAALLLIGLEVLARIAFQDTFIGRFEYGYHPTAGFIEKADRVELRSAGGRRFWNQSFSLPKPIGRFRIFTVGDSVARGNSLEQAYPYQLGEILRARGLDVESLNLSVAGYGSRRRLIVLSQALKYEPDLIILHLNHSNEYEDERDWRRAEVAKSWRPDQWLRKSYVIARLDEAKTERLFWQLPAKIRTTREVNDFGDEATVSQDKEQVKKWDQLFRDKTLETVRLLQARGIPVVLVTKASLDASRIRLEDFGQDAFAATLLGPSVSMISTRQVFSRVPGFERYFSRDRTHWKPEGHSLMAETFVSMIEGAVRNLKKASRMNGGINFSGTHK